MCVHRRYGRDFTARPVALRRITAPQWFWMKGEDAVGGDIGNENIDNGSREDLHQAGTISKGFADEMRGKDSP